MTTGINTNVHLIHKDNVFKNNLQVINQYVPAGGTHANRYDVTILVNESAHSFILS